MLLSLYGAAPALAASEFEVYCNRELPPTRVSVTSEPSQVQYNFSKSVRDLTAKHSYHSAGTTTLGLTESELKISARWNWSSIAGSGGQACFRPGISVFLTVSPQTVYVGKEFPERGCAFNAILEHELRHVQANQTHLEAVTDYYQAAIAEALGQKVFYGDLRDLKQQMSATFKDYWTERISADLKKVKLLHAQIDSPEEYARNNTICNSEIPQLLFSAGIRH